MMTLPKITRSIAGLIDTIYALDDRKVLFRTFCTRLEQMVPFASALFTPFDVKNGKFLFMNHLRHHMEERDVQLLCSCCGSCHPVVQSTIYRDLLTKRKNVPVRITDVIPASRLPATEYFRKFLSKNVAFYELFAMLGLRQCLIGCLLLQREKRDGDFADRDREIVGILLPHFSRAFHNLNVHEQTEFGLTALGASPDAIEHIYPLLIRFRLTPRQVEIASLTVLGNTNRQIAAKLSITEQTVKEHVERIFRRIGVRHRSELSARVLMNKAA